MQQIVILLKQTFLNMFTKTTKNPLGRWNIETCQKKINYKIDMSNVDHCGPCGLKSWFTK